MKNPRTHEYAADKSRNLWVLNPIVTVYCVISTIFTACAPPRQNDIPRSQLRYAHTPGWENATMLALQPGSTLYVCDKGSGATGDIVKAIREWAAAAGIDRGLQTQEGCGNKYEVSTEVGPCDAAAVTSHWGVPGQWKITYCGQNWTKSYDITLHEVGHMYGQCDRYGSGGFGHPVRGANCSDQGRGSDGAYNLPSAMQAGGPAHPHRVTDDDRNGLKALMARNDIRGAQRWRDFTASPNSSSNDQASGTPLPNPTINQNQNQIQNQNSNPNLPPSTNQSSPIGSGGNAPPPQVNSPCASFFNQLIENCDSNGICTLVQKAVCGG